MKCVTGTFNGTGAAVYICCGFVPDKVTVWAPEDSELAHVLWSRSFTAAESNNGFLNHGGDQTFSLYTKGNGIEPYEGGDVLTSSTQSSVAYGEGVYLKFDLQDYRANTSYGCVSDTIDTWTLDTSANSTGHFNEDVVSSGNRIGEGSRIIIDETLTGKRIETLIEAVTAGQGESADEVTLARAVKAGKVRFIGGMYTTIPIPVGDTTPAGFKLNATTDINENDQIQAFEAVLFDN